MIVGIIGDQGRMAQEVLRPIFLRDNNSVIGSDRKKLEGLFSNAEVAREADVIFVLTLPIQEVRTVITNLVPHLKPGTLLLHGTSIQDPWKNELSPVLRDVRLVEKRITTGFCHFMFGPMIQSWRGQSVVYGFLEEPDGRWRKWLVELLTREKLILQECSPDFHDWLTDEIHVIPMIGSFLLGQMWHANGFNLGQALELAGPPFWLQAMGVVRNSLQPDIMAEIVINHPYTERTLAFAEEALEKIGEFRETRNIAALARLAKSFLESIPQSVRENISEATQWHIQLQGDLRHGAVVLRFTPEENRLGLLRDVLGVFDDHGLSKTTSWAQETADHGCIFVIGLTDPDHPGVEEVCKQVQHQFGGQRIVAAR